MTKSPQATWEVKICLHWRKESKVQRQGRQMGEGGRAREELLVRRGGIGVKGPGVKQGRCEGF